MLYRTFTIVLLFCSVSFGQRFFASGEHGVRGAVMDAWFHLVDDSGRDVWLKQNTADLDVTINGKESVTIHELSYFFEQSTQQFIDGLPLMISSEYRIFDTTLPLLLNDPARDDVYRLPFDEAIPEIRIYGTYDGIEFEVTNEDFRPRIGGSPGNLIFGVFYDGDEVVMINDGPGVAVLVDFGLGETRMSMQGRPRHQDIQRVPTVEERAMYLPGDVDLDGEVTFADFLTLSDRFGGRGTWGHGDFNADFEVGFADFLILSDNFGRPVNVAIPEPNYLATVAALTVVIVFLSQRRKR